jgi:hypothetical protein
MPPFSFWRDGERSGLSHHGEFGGAHFLGKGDLGFRRGGLSAGRCAGALFWRRPGAALLVLAHLLARTEPSPSSTRCPCARRLHRSGRCSRVHLFKLESLEDFWRKRAFSSKHLIEQNAVDPRLPRPGRLTARPIDDFTQEAKYVVFVEQMLGHAVRPSGYGATPQR